MTIEAENLNEPQKPQLNIGAVSGSLLVEIKTLLEQYRDEEMPDWQK